MEAVSVLCETFQATLLVLAGVLAVASAVILLLVVAGVLLAVLSWMFDGITDALRKRWHRRGKRPRGKWAEAIARGDNDGNGD